MSKLLLLLPSLPHEMHLTKSSVEVYQALNSVARFRGPFDNVARFSRWSFDCVARFSKLESILRGFSG